MDHFTEKEFKILIRTPLPRITSNIEVGNKNNQSIAHREYILDLQKDIFELNLKYL